MLTMLQSYQCLRSALLRCILLMGNGNLKADVLNGHLLTAGIQSLWECYVFSCVFHNVMRCIASWDMGQHLGCWGWCGGGGVERGGGVGLGECPCFRLTILLRLTDKSKCRVTTSQYNDSL